MASKEKTTAHQEEHTGSSRILLDPEGECLTMSQCPEAEAYFGYEAGQWSRTLQ